MMIMIRDDDENLVLFATHNAGCRGNIHSLPRIPSCLATSDSIDVRTRSLLNKCIYMLMKTQTQRRRRN